MYTMSPEDRLRLVVRQQSELRDEMARERMATAASAKGSTKGPAARPSTRTARGARIPHVGVAAQHLLHAITGRHGVTPHGVTR